MVRILSLGQAASPVTKLMPTQVRGARGMLGWSMLDLARAARVSISAVKQMEMSILQPVSEEAHANVRSALEEAGIRFLTGSGEGGGVWLDRG